MGVLANFSTKINIGERSVGRKLDVMKKVGAEGSDKVVGVFTEVGVFGE